MTELNPRKEIIMKKKCAATNNVFKNNVLNNGLITRFVACAAFVCVFGLGEWSVVFAQASKKESPRSSSKELVRLSNPEGMTQPKAYSHVGEVLGGKLVFLSGQVSQDSAGNVVGKGDIRAQTRQIFANLEAGLKSVGGDWSSVVKMNTYITDAANIAAFREVREELMANVQPRPASTAVVVSKLFGDDWLLEIEIIAVVPEKASEKSRQSKKK
jgi:enamine deaminase RidA (YjgF/YER057c/UK114 family)